MDFYRGHQYLPVYQYGRLHLMRNPVYDRRFPPGVISEVVDPIQSLSGNVLGGARRRNYTDTHRSGNIASKLRSALNQFNRPHFNKRDDSGMYGGRRRRMMGRGIGII